MFSATSVDVLAVTLAYLLLDPNTNKICSIVVFNISNLSPVDFEAPVVTDYIPVDRDCIDSPRLLILVAYISILSLSS